MSSAAPPRSFLGTAVLLFALLSGFAYGAIVLIDPYNLWSWSLERERVPVSSNHRMTYAALSRQPAFGNALVGSSTMRNLDPSRVAELGGLPTVNLAMNAATPAEQGALARSFVRHGERTALVLGIDTLWCKLEAAMPRPGAGVLPAWMLDDNPANDFLHLLNEQTLTDAVRLVEFWRGSRTPKFDALGYRPFRADLGTYDAAAAAARIRAAMPSHAEVVPEHPYAFPTRAELTDIAEASRKVARLVVVFTPLHADYLAQVEPRMAACKAMVTARLASHPGLIVLDYMQASAFTANDAHFWDAHHMTDAPTRLIEQDIGWALTHGGTPDVARLRPP